MEVLSRLRKQRNLLVHGQIDVIDDSELERGVALLSRIILYAGESQLRRSG